MLRSIMMASVLVLSVAACGGDDEGDDGGDDNGGNDVDVLAASACATPDATITTTGLAFTNGSPTISVGDKVLFMPGGGHDMLSDNGKFDTGALAASACLQFNTAGNYPYKCSAHPSMVGSVKVE